MVMALAFAGAIATVIQLDVVGGGTVARVTFTCTAKCFSTWT